MCDSAATVPYDVRPEAVVQLVKEVELSFLWMPLSRVSQEGFMSTFVSKPRHWKFDWHLEVERLSVVCFRTPAVDLFGPAVKMF